jgi:hypothetical protein
MLPFRTNLLVRKHRSSRFCGNYFLLPALRSLLRMIRLNKNKNGEALVWGFAEFLCLVRMRGLEPPRCHHHRLLRPARLPVPPHPQIMARSLCEWGCRVSRRAVFVDVLLETLSCLSNNPKQADALVKEKLQSEADKFLQASQ